MTETPFRKATAFVTRITDAGVELLTFIHPLGGRQLPAGSIEDGEDPVDGVQREVWEETGIREFNQITLLDVETTRLKGLAQFHLDVDSRKINRLDSVSHGMALQPEVACPWGGLRHGRHPVRIAQARNSEIVLDRTTARS